MRYFLKRDLAGEWGIWDTRRQVYHCTGLEVEEARKTAEELNEKNEREVREFLDK